MSDAVLIALIGALASSGVLLEVARRVRLRPRPATTDDRLTRLDAQVVHLERELATVQRLQRYTLDYAEQLRRWISEGNPPPPPPWPPHLTFPDLSAPTSEETP